MRSGGETGELTAEERREIAEALKYEAEAEKIRAEAREALALAAKAELEYQQLKRQHDEELASNRYHHVYHFTEVLTPQTVRACLNQLTIWHRLDPGCPLEIVFTSPGGSVIDGMVLFDYIQELRRAGHTVTTAALGMAASMAGVLLQAGDRRVMSKEAWLLIHEASFGAVGRFGEVEDQLDWVKRIQDRILDIFAARARMKRAEIKRRWRRKDWWISSEEALRWGFVDEVR